MKMFLEYIDKKQRESRRHLKIMERLFKKNGLKAEAHLDGDDPYIYLKSTDSKLSFDGVRIYEIGNVLAYRVAKEEKTEPYGRAYQLNLEEMFNDFMSENDIKEEEAGKQVVKGVLNELNKFFERSADAERDLQKADSERGLILKAGNGSDYSSLVFTKS